MWARRPRLPHTHTQPRRTIVPKTVATSLAHAMHQDPTSRRCGHARRRSTPTPRAMHKQHTEPRPSCCVPFGDPHVHNVTPSSNTRQECNHSSANRRGTSPPYGEDTPDRRPVQRKEKGGGTSAKGSVLILTCVPLPRLVLPLRQRHHEVRQGDTHGSGSATIRVSPCQTSNAKLAMAH